MTGFTATVGSLSATAIHLSAEFSTMSEKSPIQSLAYVFMGGRRVWTFRVEPEHWDDVAAILHIGWPAALVPRLSGVCDARLELRPAAGSPATHVAEADLDFGGSAGKLQLLDPLTGDELVINKWGRLAKSFEAASDELQQAVLVSAQNLVSLLKESLGLELFITGGTLLGLVRDGKLIADDDDADLAYLSAHENPSDIVLESYEVERVLADNGLETVRHSSGHLQVMFRGTDYTDRYYVDIFTYFITNGWFYGTFHAREKSGEITIYPIKSISHESLELPIPADTDQMLAAIYGPSWNTPDPAFSFVTPDSASRRFYWWFNHFDPYREDWEDYHRALISNESQREASPLAQWLITELPRNSAVLELGCGFGTDAIALAKVGHKVLATDYSRPAISRATNMSLEAFADTRFPTGTVQFEVTNVNSLRQMAATTKKMAEFAGTGKPITVLSRNLFDNLHYLGRDNALLIISHLLDRGGRAYLQVRNPKMNLYSRDPHEPRGERIFDPWEFSGRLAHYGLEILKHNFFEEPDSAGTTLSYIIGKVQQ